MGETRTLTSLIPVPVHRHTLFVADATAPLVPLRPICDALGIDIRTQRRRVLSHPTLSKGGVIIAFPSPGGPQETLCLETWLLPGWLMTIHPDKVAPRARDTLIAFQREASQLLYEAWFARRAGMPAQPGRPAGDLLERVEGPPALRDHPAVAQAIALALDAGDDIAAAFRAARSKQREARRHAARAGLSARELRILVERERWNARHPTAQGGLLADV